MIRLDRGDRSIVGVCVCGARDVFLTARAADAWALEHVYRAHPKGAGDVSDADRNRAITASRKRRERE